MNEHKAQKIQDAVVVDAKKEKNILMLVAACGLLLGIIVGYFLWGNVGSPEVELFETEPQRIINSENQQVPTSTEPVAEVPAEETEKQKVEELVAGIEQNQAAVIESVTQKENEVVVSGQNAGPSVKIDSFKIAAASWIAVHDDVNGELGNVLGARRFVAGQYSASNVPLLRATIPAKKYYVGIYLDNGDGKFDRKSDTLLREPDGEMIGSTFTTL